MHLFAELDPTVLSAAVLDTLPSPRWARRPVCGAQSGRDAASMIETFPLGLGRLPGGQVPEAVSCAGCVAAAINEAPARDPKPVLHHRLCDATLDAHGDHDGPCRCRCGAPAVLDDPDCEWHKSVVERAERALADRGRPLTEDELDGVSRARGRQRDDDAADAAADVCGDRCEERPPAWVAPFTDWAAGDVDDLDFNGADVPDRVRGLLEGRPIAATRAELEAAVTAGVRAAAPEPLLFRAPVYDESRRPWWRRRRRDHGSEFTPSPGFVAPVMALDNLTPEGEGR